MGFFEENKALIITVLLFCILLLAMVNIRLANSTKEMSTTMIDLANYEVEETEEEVEQVSEPAEPATPPETPSVRTHQAYNQNQEESQDLDSRLEEIFERNSAQSNAAEEESTSTSSGEVDVTTNTSKEQEERSDGDDTSENSSTRPGSIKNSSISFSLVGRTAIDIPNPIYTCDTGGKVVVNITVDEQGTVTQTSINQASSSTKNECLTDMAEEYARNAVFSELPGRDSQPGTITYNFQG